MEAGNSFYFSPQFFAPDFFTCAMEECPAYLRDLYFRRRISQEDVNTFVQEDEDEFFDHWNDSCLYHLNLFDAVNKKKWNTRKFCFIQEGFGFNSIYSPDVCFGRSFEDYKGFSYLKLKLWRILHPWLSTVSKICPPNSCQVATCFDHIPTPNEHPHREVDGKGIIVGSSVIKVSLFDSQMLEIGLLEDGDVINGGLCVWFPIGW